MAPRSLRWKCTLRGLLCLHEMSTVQKQQNGSSKKKKTKANTGNEIAIRRKGPTDIKIVGQGGYSLREILHAALSAVPKGTFGALARASVARWGEPLVRSSEAALGKDSRPSQATESTSSMTSSPEREVSANPSQTLLDELFIPNSFGI